MKNKIVKLLTLLGVGILSSGTSFAADVCDVAGIGNLCNKLTTIVQQIGNQYSTHVNEIHYIGGGENGNNFGGFFVMTSNPQLAHPVTLSVEGQNPVVCKNRLEGYYFSAARGNILLPITSSQLQTLKTLNPNYNDISLEGGLFSNCDDKYILQKQHNTIVGNISYKENGQDMFSIIGGRQYDLYNNILTGQNLVGNLQIKDQTIPIGFFYDSNFGVSFLGGKIIAGTAVPTNIDKNDPNTPEILKKEGVTALIDLLNNYTGGVDILNEIKSVDKDPSNPSSNIITFKSSNDGFADGAAEKLNGDVSCSNYAGATTDINNDIYDIIGTCPNPSVQANATKLLSITKPTIARKVVTCGTNTITFCGLLLPRGNEVKVASNLFLAALQSIIAADGLIGLSNSNTGDNVSAGIIQSKKLVYDQNSTGDIVVTKSNILNISDFINKGRQNAEILCRGKWNSNAQSIINGDICIDDTNGGKTFVINNDLTQDGKTPNIIIKGNGNTKLVISSNQSDSGYLNIFLDKGILLLSNNISPISISAQGTLNPSGGETQFNGTYLRGNFLVNGLLAGTDSSNVTGYNHRLFLEGSFGSLNTVGKPADSRKEQIEGIFGGTNFDKYISLTKITDSAGNVTLTNQNDDTYPGIFVWKCNEDGKSSSDGTACITNPSGTTTIQQLPNTPWYIRANGNMSSFINQN